jgi:hypothetical protein
MLEDSMSRLNRNQKRRKKFKKRRYRDERWLARARELGFTFVTSARRLKLLAGTTDFKPVEIPGMFNSMLPVFRDIWVVPEEQKPVPVPEEYRGKGFLLARIPVEGDLNSVNVTFDEDMKVVVEGLPAALGVPKEYLFPSGNLNEQQARARMNYYRMTQGLEPLPEKESEQVFPDDVFDVVEARDETKAFAIQDPESFKPEPMKYPEGGVFHFEAKTGPDENRRDFSAARDEMWKKAEFESSETMVMSGVGHGKKAMTEAVHRDMEAKGVKVLHLGPDTKLKLGEKIHELAQRGDLPTVEGITVTRELNDTDRGFYDWVKGQLPPKPDVYLKSFTDEDGNEVPPVLPATLDRGEIDLIEVPFEIVSVDLAPKGSVEMTVESVHDADGKLVSTSLVPKDEDDG